MTFTNLEGCDGAGKSSIAAAVVELLKRTFPQDTVELLHFSQLKTDPIEEYALRFENYRPGGTHHVVCDRWAWGETIYGPLYRGESKLSEAAFRWVELHARARGAVTFEVTASLETIQTRLATRGEDYLQSRDVRHVWKAFNAVSARSLTSAGIVDTDVRTTEQWADTIVNAACHAEGSAADVFRPEYIGRDLPTVLVVGDTHGPSHDGATAAPFIARGRGCGQYLLEALPELWWRQVGLVNANQTDVARLWKDLYEPAVVALGGEASKTLTAAGVPHSRVPHPQYVKRFHNARQREYGSLIKEASKREENYSSWPK